MRIASNKLRSLQAFFVSELKHVYSAEEIQTLFIRAAEHYLGWNGTKVLSHLEENLNQSEVLKLYDCAKELAKGKPLQYILGESWFYGLKLKVNSAVLIPRPETEELVELVLKSFTAKTGKVLDIGTGSGCIPITLKKQRPGMDIFACDISEAALGVARENAAINNALVNFFSCDILKDSLPRELAATKFNIIVSNPPYIKNEERKAMSQQVLSYEPETALFAPASDPLLFYKKILDLCKEHLDKQGMVFFELNPLTAEAVQEYAECSAIFAKTTLLKDMSGKMRFFSGEGR